MRLTKEERALIQLLRTLEISPKRAVSMLWVYRYNSREDAKANGYDALADMYLKDLEKIKFLAKAAGLWEE